MEVDIMRRDPSLDVLLELNGTIYYEENGYWHKIEAKLVKVTPQRPHGISYNLSLHDNHNQRIFGMDNAHAVNSDRKTGFSGRIIEYDHIHTSMNNKGKPYQFKSAEQLLNDFYKQINKILNT